MIRRGALAVAAVAFACSTGCASSPSSPTAVEQPRVAPAAKATTAPANDVDVALDAVARIHGAPGPWAVLGYRMAERALADLGLQRGSFALLVTHRTPQKVQFACIADGAAAATGASLGKLNLALEDAPEAGVVTIFTRRDTGAKVAFRPTETFRARYLGADRSRARELGREVMELPEAEVFERVTEF